MPGPDRTFLTVAEVLKSIQRALDRRQPFSLVRVGDGENIVLAQDSVMSLEEVLATKWAIGANKGEKGVTLPNLKLRDEMVECLNKANIVGIPFWDNDPIIADPSLKRALTEKTFEALHVRPKQVCHTFVNRVFAQKPEFWSMLEGKRVALISGWADQVSEILSGPPYNLQIAFTINFKHYRKMERALVKMERKKDQFDIALLSCGVNAVVLAPLIAEQTGKVALDFGKSLMFIVKKKAGLEHSSHQATKDMLP
ncbi:GT-D fold domain-containing glycosyltransferase [Paenibacillus koleovorans]|uniref:GT-D fold domain-containing glycosyltransferase n=1 Tax=Paenibacillus koleovorans TaxID=121608 RepID=UPI001580672A|nr:GT-D fold domain-containing glycosyltransferase [Paenibacillus koleovorans]